MEFLADLIEMFLDEVEEIDEDVVATYVYNDAVCIVERIDGEVLVGTIVGVPTFIDKSIDALEEKEEFSPHTQLYQLVKKFMTDNSIYDLETVLQSESMMNRLDDFNTQIFEIMRDELDRDE